ncbi:hypothetical protein GBA52_017010 [Prunus armeniaca]|nr:hypothetical protein GBA52_017010 [Prunus armeniaca]
MTVASVGVGGLLVALGRWILFNFKPLLKKLKYRLDRLSTEPIQQILTTRRLLFKLSKLSIWSHKNKKKISIWSCKSTELRRYTDQLVRLDIYLRMLGQKLNREKLGIRI